MGNVIDVDAGICETRDRNQGSVKSIDVSLSLLKQSRQ